MTMSCVSYSELPTPPSEATTIALSEFCHALCFLRLSLVVPGPEHMYLHQLWLIDKLKQKDSDLVQVRHGNTTLFQHLSVHIFNDITFKCHKHAIL